MNKDRAAFLLTLFAFLVFVVGVVQLINLRLSAGDVYPPYSSLRSDPLGIKAFYESLETCCGLSVRRNYDAFSRSKNETDAVFLFAGVNASEIHLLPESLVREFDSFIRNGGRFVICFLPQVDTSPPVAERLQEKEESKEKGKKQDAFPAFTSLAKEWGFELHAAPLTEDSDATLHLKDIGLPGTISCHTTLYFDRLNPAWQVVYDRQEHPVLIERKWGNGSIVLSTLSYFLSNEAMLKERHAGLLAWLVDGYRKVIFDEYHHGIFRSPGVAVLMRKYHLQWLVVGLLVLAGLYIWKSSVSLVPPPPGSRRGEEPYWSKGKDSAEGLINLLRRAIPEKEILAACHREWKKSATQARLSKNKLEGIDSKLVQGSKGRIRPQDLVAVYNQVSRICKERE